MFLVVSAGWRGVSVLVFDWQRMVGCMRQSKYTQAGAAMSPADGVLWMILQSKDHTGLRIFFFVFKTNTCSWMTRDYVPLCLVDSFQSINPSTTSAFVMRSKWTKALCSHCFSLRIIHKFLWYWRVLMTAALKRLFNWGYWSFLCNIGNQIIQNWSTRITKLARSI